MPVVVRQVYTPLMTLVRLSDNAFTFARHADAARAFVARLAITVHEGAMRRARILCCAAAVCAALSELRWLLQADVSMTASFLTNAQSAVACRAR